MAVNSENVSFLAVRPSDLESSANIELPYTATMAIVDINKLKFPPYQVGMIAESTLNINRSIFGPDHVSTTNKGAVKISEIVYNKLLNGY